MGQRHPRPTIEHVTEQALLLSRGGARHPEHAGPHAHEDTALEDSLQRVGREAGGVGLFAGHEAVLRRGDLPDRSQCVHATIVPLEV